MKLKKIVLIAIIALFGIVSCSFLLDNNEAVASTSQNLITTLIDKYGLEINVADVQPEDVTSVEDYIRNNLDDKYCQNNKFVPMDIIYVKNLIAELSKLPSEKTIDSIYNGGEDAFIMLNDTYVLLYDVDEDSDYYVGLVDTMHNDVNSTVTDISFAYTNLNGEVIGDAIYDNKTGLAYVPKKYTVENKNGLDVCNVQIELLQAINSSKPTASFNVVVENEEGLAGNFVTTGKVTTDASNIKVGVRIALDEEAIKNLNQNYLKVFVNGDPIKMWDYYSECGILVAEVQPSTIETLTININQNNIEENANRGIATADSFDDMNVYTPAGTWEVSQVPQEGVMFTVKGKDIVKAQYYDDERYVHGLALYFEDVSNFSENIAKKVWRGDNIDINNLFRSGAMVQYDVNILKDITATDANGTEYSIPKALYQLRCAHNSDYFDTEHSGPVSWEIRVRVIKATDDYLLVGMLTSSVWTQAGSGLMKISYRVSAGNLEVGKKDNYGSWVAGAKLAVSGPDGFYREVVTTSDGPTLIEGVKKGEYTVTELEAPMNMVKNTTPVTVNAVPGQTIPATVVDSYQRGSAKLIKYDAKNRENPRGDATLEGAIFDFCAAEDIYEGIHLVYNANQVIKTVRTDVNGETEKIESLPIGNYYYIETAAPLGYRKIEDRINISVDYMGQNSNIATEKVAEAPETTTTSNLKIVKSLSATDYDPEIKLKGAKFKLVLKKAIGTPREADNTYYSEPTDENGVCEFLEIPFGLYVLEEITVPVESLKMENREIDFREDGKTYSLNITDKSKVITIKVIKVDADKKASNEPDYKQGDAKLEGAEYTIYRNYENGVLSGYVDKIVTNHQDSEGYWCAESGTLRTGTYYVKETKASEGYLLDEKVYTYTQDVAEQTIEKVPLVKTSDEKVKRGRVEVVKFDTNNDGTEQNPATGAVLRLTLNSNKATYYDATIDERGYAEFLDTEWLKEHPDEIYTIPYGRYTISEVRGSNSGEHTHYYIQLEGVVIERQDQNEYRILEDLQVELILHLTKVDTESGATVALPGAKFKVWDVKRDEFLSQKYTPDGNYIDEFETNENGTAYLPQKIDAGEYIIYETQAPYGYYLEDDWRLPENKSDIGLIGKGGKYVNITKSAMGIEQDSTGRKDVYFEIRMPDEDSKGKIVIEKSGEVFSGVTQVTETYKEKYEVSKPKFEVKGLEGVTYEIYAAEDIKSPDGNYTYVKSGTKVDTITTNSDGVAESIDLHLGEYQIKETKTPEGYLIDENIPNVVLTNDDQYVEVQEKVLKLNNVRQKLTIEVPKMFEQVKYSATKNIEKTAVFGVYADQDFKLNNGSLAISRETLVGMISVIDGKMQDTSKLDLPAGKYYVKEVETSFPYSLLDEVAEVTLAYDDSGNEVVKFKTKEFLNTPETSKVTLIKLSTSNIEDLVLKGENIDISNIDEELAKILKDINGMTIEEVKQYLTEKNLKFVAGAKYGIYTDEACKKPLYMLDENNEWIEAVMITDDSGMVTMDDIPLGRYYFKEIEAPKGYELSKDTIELNLTYDQKDALIYQAIIEDAIKGRFITKTDIFTGDVVPDCKFEIRDMDENKVLESVTDNKGIAYIPTDIFENGETYQFVELEAPGIYDLNTEPHEFVAQKDEDGNWTAQPIEVENRRKTITGSLTVRKVDDKTGEPLEGCKFSIVLLDDNGEPYVNKDGKTIYLVENAVTDKNGEYTIDKVPYGTYKFIEVEAPEGYEKVEEEMENYVFTIDENSTDNIIFEVANTGDIAVYALSAVALASIFEIAYVAIKNKKVNY